MNRADIFWAIHESYNPAGFYTPEFKDLISCMMHPRPSYRPTLVDIIGHDWVKNTETALPIDVFNEMKRRKTLIKNLKMKEREQS